MGIRIRFWAAAALAVTPMLIAATPASAGVVCDNAGSATFAAADVSLANCGVADGATEVNTLHVDVNASGTVTFTDTNPITDGDGAGGCSVSANTAVCPGAAGYSFDLGGSDDAATVGAVASAGVSTGGDGNDTLTGGPLSDSLSGGLGNDSISGGGGADSLDGGAGNDMLSGEAGNDALAGGSGTDSLDGGAGNDVLDGGDGNDTLAGGAGDDIESGGAGDDSVAGGDGSDRLEGDPTTGSCTGSAGSDEVSGDAGDDIICAGDGPAFGTDADVMNGGDGFDRVLYPRSAPVTVTIDGIANDGEAGEKDNVKLDVEAVTGGAGDDTLTGNDGPNALDGGAGADTLNGLGGADVLVDTGGDVASDTFNGGDGDDVLGDAGAGADTYNGGDGEDTLVAYAGRRTAVNITLDGVADDGAAGEGDNIAPDVEDAVGGSGDDTIVGSAADNELDGGAGNDTIAGGDGNDGLHGGAGRDTIDGGPGRDLLDGGAGADALKSRDGVTDRDVCGGGTDSVAADGRDDVAGDCEKTDIAPPAAVAIRSIVVTRAGFVVVRIGCPIVERFCGGVTIVKTVRRVGGRFIKLGQVNYQREPGGATKIIRGRIANADRRPLRRARRVKVRALVTNVNPVTGDSTSATKLATVTTRGL